MIDVPKLMRTLPRDHRGYVIPYNVLRDKKGQPLFTINDSRCALECVKKKLCSICGKRLTDEGWFVAGSRAFLHPVGAMLDPPTHLECAEYALKVCPFLAAPRYNRTIADRKLTDENKPDNLKLTEFDFQPPRLPESFGLGIADCIEMGVRRDGTLRFYGARWRYVEFWKKGERCNAPDRPEGPLL